MNKPTIIWKTAALAAMGISHASAQHWELAPVAGQVRFSTTNLGSPNSFEPESDDTRVKGTGVSYGGRVTLNTKGYYGFELGFLRSKANLATKFRTDDDTADTLASATVPVYQGSFNALCYFMPLGERYRPFFTAGVQAQRWANPGLEHWNAGGSTNIGINYGGGLKIRLSRYALLRLDVRDVLTGAPYRLRMASNSDGVEEKRSRMRQLELTAGIGFTF